MERVGDEARQGCRPGGPHPDYRDPIRRRSLLALLDDGFPGLSQRIAVADAAGFPWDAVTEPFVTWEGDEAVAHVGVLEHRVVLAGELHLTAGVHAVVTRHDRRHRGLARTLLDEALAWSDPRYAIAKLGTDVPAVYARHGFRPFLLHKFRVDHRGGEGRGVPLDADGQRSFVRRCLTREPVSHRYASLDPGWLVGIDLALQRRSLAQLTWIASLDAVVDWTLRGKVLAVHDIFAPALPPLADLLAHAPAHEAVELYCCPDRLAPEATAVPIPEAGVWMARGAWPIDHRLPIGISRLAEH